MKTGIDFDGWKYPTVVSQLLILSDSFGWIKDPVAPQRVLPRKIFLGVHF